VRLIINGEAQQLEVDPGIVLDSCAKRSI